MPTQWLPGMNVLVVLQLHIIVSVAAVLMKVILKAMRHLVRVSKTTSSQLITECWPRVILSSTWYAIEVVLDHRRRREHGLLRGGWRELISTLGRE